MPITPKHTLAVAALAFLLHAPSASAGALCSSSEASPGIWNVKQSYLNAEIRNYSMTANTVELWVSPRASGTITACIDTATGWTKPGKGIMFTANPVCNTNGWGYTIIALKDGDRQSDGTVRHIGRIPLTQDEYNQKSKVHSYYKLNYDYKITLNSQKYISGFCIDDVSGTMDSGTSDYWDPAMVYGWTDG